MTINDATIIISKGLAGIASIFAISYSGQLIISVVYGASVLAGTGKLLFLLLPAILIWSILPKIVEKIYKGQNELNLKTFKTILALCVGVAFGLTVIVEFTSFLVAWFTYPDRMLNYESALIAKAAGIITLIVATMFIIRKSKNV